MPGFAPHVDVYFFFLYVFFSQEYIRERLKSSLRRIYVQYFDLNKHSKALRLLLIIWLDNEL